MSQPPPPPSQPPRGSSAEEPETPQQPVAPEGTPQQPSQQPPSGGFGPPTPPQGGNGAYGYPQQPPPGGAGYGYPQQPPQGGGYGYGYAQQPVGQPGLPGQPDQPGQPGQFGAPGAPGTPYGQPPGMYPTGPYGPGGPGVPGPGGGGGGNGKAIAIIAAAVAAVLAVVTIGFFMLRDDGDPEAGGSGGSSTGGTGGPGGGKPASTEGRELFKIPSPKLTAEESVSVTGAWATDKIFAKSTLNGIIGMDAASGKQAWKISLDGQICAASRHTTDDGKTAVIVAETKSSRAKCNQMAVVDLNKGRKLWQEKMPGSDSAVTLGMSMTVSQNVVAAKWIGGSVAYEMSGGAPLWQSHGGTGCEDEGFAGGKELMAVVQCGSYSDPKLKVQKLNPKTGDATWEFDVPEGVQNARIVSSDPVVLAVSAGTSTPTDVMTVGDDEKLKSKISLGDRKYDPGCGTDVESCVSIAVDKNYVYLPSARHQGDTASTNEIIAFDQASGKPKWKSDAGEKRTIVPVRMQGDKLIAYKKPTYDAGGQIVAVDPGAQGKQELYLRNPDDTAEIENNIAGITMREPPLYQNGRLFLHQTLISKRITGSYGKYLGIGFGAE